MNEQIYNQLLTLVSQSMPGIDTTDITSKTRLIEDLGYDSLGLMILVLNVEKAFNVSFDVPYFISTIDDIYEYVINHKNNIK